MSNRPPFHTDWIRERQETKDVADWRGDLLSRVGSLSRYAREWATQVGHGSHEIQIQYERPINASFSFDRPDLVWTQLKVWEPNTKKPGTRVIRFGPDTGVLMCLVKVPTEHGFDWYLLFRRKYQLAGKALFFEYSRGWTPGSTNEDRGRGILERDFPGIVGSPMVAEIKESKLGAPVWENNAELSNKITHHLIVITLQKGVGIHEFGEMLTEERVKEEFSEYRFDIEREFLTTTPTLLPLNEAAEVLNSHLTDDPNLHYFFGENFSVGTWTRFLAIHGRQFPHLMPKASEEI